MDSKAVFVRTHAGENESSGKSANLYSAIKRALLMVDGVATFGEISKRAAPSLRDSLDAMFQELEKGGYIQSKDKIASAPRPSVPIKMSVQKLADPTKADSLPKFNAPTTNHAPESAPSSTSHRRPPPPKTAPAKPLTQGNNPKVGGVLDFSDDFFSSMPAQLAAKSSGGAKPSDKPAAQPADDSATLKAQLAAQAILLKAEQDAAKIREQALRETQQASAEIAALQAQAQLAKQAAQAAQLKAAREVKARAQAEKLLQQQAAERQATQAAQFIPEILPAPEISPVADVQVAPKLQSNPALQPIEFKLDPFVFDIPTEPAQKPPVTPPPAAPQQTVLPEQKLQADNTPLSPNTQFAPELESPELILPEIKPPEVKLPEIKPAPEIKLDPVFILDSFKIQASSATASQKNLRVGIETEPEIKLNFDAPPLPAQRKPAPVAPPKSAPATAQPAEHKPNLAPNKKPVEQHKTVPEQLNLIPEQHNPVPEQSKKSAGHTRDKVKAQATPSQPPAEKIKADIPVAELAVQKIAPASAVIQASPAAARVSIARSRRQPFAWGKLTIVVLVLLVGALFVVPYLLPTRDYMAEVEKMLSKKLQQPVHIGQLGGRILPTPQLVLGEIYIGNAKQFQVRQAQIDFSFQALIGEFKPINSIELQGVKVSGEGLLAASAWLQQLAADELYPVRRMVISQGALDADVIQFTGIAGELIFNQNGKFTQANLRANDGKVALGITAAQPGKLQLAITIRGSAPPLLPRWSFDELIATGEVDSNGLKITEFDGRLLGGMLQGEATIDWRSGWRVLGTLAAKSITMQNISQGLSGDMEGSARFQMQAVSLPELADTAKLEGTFTVKKGGVNGIDIIETARLRSKESTPGGRTRFDELSGVLTATKDSYVIRQLKISAGELAVSGSLDITGSQLSGKISTDLSKWAEIGKVTLQVGGTIDNPTLRAAR